MTGGGADVSIVITTYYRNDLLEDAIESALKQTHESIEVIVVDGSGDGHARTLVEQYPAVSYVPLAGRSDAHAARNVGVTHADGLYIQFLDDDDLLHPEKIAKQLPMFSESVGVVYSGYRPHYRGSWPHEKGEVVLPEPGTHGSVLDEMLRIDKGFPDACYTCTMLIDRQVLDRIMPLRNCHAADDLGMKIELALRTEFDYVDEPLVERRMDSDDSLGASLQNVEGRFRVINQYAEVYDQYPPVLRRTVLEHTHWLQGSRELEERVWSPKAPLSFLRAAYYSPNDRLKLGGLALFSLLGSPGVRLGRRGFRELKRIRGHDPGEDPTSPL
ncbi:glycosyltransferase family 2 protein [Natronococcus occultus]|uniref:Glycosyl transferase n=1 Tax=Natronococcus occultus SP4 TaxID=694430 RepID=L0K5C2_9EURY|nr:glycosyltransferase family 2 protein [Natronococcus occultus]AGB39288.1 glycosyl transferase [Natronococcus occultus SP4]